VNDVESGLGPRWGRFNVRFRDNFSLLPANFAWRVGMSIVAQFMNTRSRLTGISTGDQAQFMQRTSFLEMKGFPAQLLMEDVEFSKRACSLFGAPLNLLANVIVSPRKWQQHGFFRTIVLMWKLRWQYWRGANPTALHRAYYGNK
jgi:hypothetical protein